MCTWKVYLKKNDTSILFLFIFIFYYYEYVFFMWFFTKFLTKVASFLFYIWANFKNTLKMFIFVLFIIYSGKIVLLKICSWFQRDLIFFCCYPFFMCKSLVKSFLFGILNFVFYFFYVGEVSRRVWAYCVTKSILFGIEKIGKPTRGELESIGSSDILYKKIQKTSNIPLKGSFLTFCIEDVRRPWDQLT
jgi:hypothetical protein